MFCLLCSLTFRDSCCVTGSLSVLGSLHMVAETFVNAPTVQTLDPRRDERLAIVQMVPGYLFISWEG